MARVSLSGGEPRKVLEDVWLADWPPDGRELAVLRRVDDAFQLECPIGSPIVRPLGQVSRFRISPSGDRVALEGEELTVHDRSGKKISTLPVPSQRSGLAWDGDEALWVLAGETQTARSLWRVTLDGKAREVYRSIGTMGLLHDAAPDGRLLVHHGFERVGVKAKPPGEAHERDLSVFSRSSVFYLSEAGSQVLISEFSGDTGLSFLRSTRDGPPVPLGEGHPHALSPDGKWALLDARS